MASAVSSPNSPTPSPNVSLPPPRVYQTARQIRGEKILDRMEWVTKAFLIISLVSFVLSAVFIGMGSANMIHPFASLYAFSGTVASWIVIAINSSCEKSVAENHDIHLEDYFDAKYDRKSNNSGNDNTSESSSNNTG